MMEDMNKFLSQSRAALQQHLTAPRGSQTGLLFHAVMGNEACDADSMISSVVYAYFKHTKGDRTESEWFLPVMSIPREEFRLRCETVALFKKLSLDVNALLFADEMPFNALHESKQLALTLTDHNQLPKTRASLDSAVVGILDHHADTQHYPVSQLLEREIAFESSAGSGGKALVGSCCTIIAERMISADALEELTSTLLLSAILLDTLNLNPKAKKTTDRDEHVVRKLETKSLIPRSELFQFLEKEKFNPDNWKTFRLEDCLKYDYKQFSCASLAFGMSSVLIDLHEVVSKAADINVELEGYCKEKELSFLAVMSMVKVADTPTRQLLFYSSKPDLLAQLKQFAVSTSELQLEPLSLKDGGTNLAAYHQRNHVPSRKQMVPLLMDFLTATET